MMDMVRFRAWIIFAELGWFLPSIQRKPHEEGLSWNSVAEPKLSLSSFQEEEGQSGATNAQLFLPKFTNSINHSTSE